MSKLYPALFISLAGFALHGCASVPEKMVEVKIPVPVYTPCPVTMPAKPAACTPKDESRPEWLRCALVEREQNRAYILEMEAQLRVCSQ